MGRLWSDLGPIKNMSFPLKRMTKSSCRTFWSTMIHAPKAETMIPILKWYFKERAHCELSANYPKKNSDWFGWCYNARKCNGYMVNRSHLDHKCEWTAQWREGWHVENTGKLQTLNLKHDCTRKKKKLLQHTSSFSVWTFRNILNLDNQWHRLCVCNLNFF